MLGDFSMFAVILVESWRGLAFALIIFLGGLQSIPNQVYEAASIDGATSWMRFKDQTLPAMRHVISLVLLVTTITTIGSFLMILILTNGDPAYATETIALHAYHQAFTTLRYWLRRGAFCGHADAELLLRALLSAPGASERAMSEQQQTPPPMAKERYSSRTRWLTNIGLILVSLFFAVPFLWIVAAAFDGDAGKYVPWPNEPTLDNFRFLFDERDVGRALRNSLFVSMYGHDAGDGAGVTGRIRTFAAALPPQDLCGLCGAAALCDSDRGNDGGDLRSGRPARSDRYLFTGLILAQTAMILPFLIWLMKGFYDGLPRYLDEAAAIDGRSTWRAWFEILLPLSKTGLAITAGFAFTAAWSEVLLVIIMITQADKATLPLQFFFSATDGRNAEVTAALGVLYLAPVLLLFLVLRRWMVRSLITSTRGL